MGRKQRKTPRAARFSQARRAKRFRCTTCFHAKYSRLRLRITLRLRLSLPRTNSAQKNGSKAKRSFLPSCVPFSPRIRSLSRRRVKNANFFIAFDSVSYLYYTLFQKGKSTYFLLLLICFSTNRGFPPKERCLPSLFLPPSALLPQPLLPQDEPLPLPLPSLLQYALRK